MALHWLLCEGVSMSGGHFDYDQYRLDSIAEKIGGLIKSNDETTPNDWGEPSGRGYSPVTLAEFEVAIRYLQIAKTYAQRIDWLVSGDDSEESFHRRLADDLAKLGEDAP